MIITVYGADGTKERKPQGYAGGQCHQATQPYERREIPGSMHKSATPEANLPEQTTAATQKTRR